MSRNRHLSINLISSIFAFLINGVISFVLTPYITNNIGPEAYGFIALGLNFITYASLITIALNSMAGRFITIEIHKENWTNANKYFNSVIRANFVIAFILAIPSVLFVVYIDNLLNIPLDLIYDVRVLFIILFANFLLGVILSTFSVATFATNKLYLKSMRTIESTIIKAIALFTLFMFFDPAVSYVGFAAFIALLYVSFFDIYYTKVYLKNIKYDKKYFNFNAIIELIKSGVWNSIIGAGQVLLSGLDLLISNIFIGAAIMGSLALAKTIPTLILSLVGVVAAVFIPTFTELYVKSNTETLVKSIKSSMKILGIIVNVPVAILIAFGSSFYSLWLPTQNPNLLQILSIITIAGIVISGPINSIYGIFTVTNKLRLNAIVLVLSGIVNIFIVLLLLEFTSLGIYAIAGVSTVLSILRNLLFTAPYGAKYLNVPKFTFFPEIIKSIIGFFIITSFALLLGNIIISTNWMYLIINCVITGIVGLIINLVIITNKDDRILIKNSLSNLFTK